MPRLIACLVLLSAVPAGALPISPATQCKVLGGESVGATQHRGGRGVILCRIGRGELEIVSLYDATILHRCPTAVRAFLHSTGEVPADCRGNPASCFCAAAGGTSVVMQRDSGDELGVCTFDDDSSVEEWTLFDGHERAPELAQALRQSGCPDGN